MTRRAIHDFPFVLALFVSLVCPIGWAGEWQTLTDYLPWQARVGCEARAVYLSTEITLAGKHSGVLYVQGELRPKPDLVWPYHAAAVLIEGKKTSVVDPAFAADALSVAEWLKFFVAPSALANLRFSLAPTGTPLAHALIPESGPVPPQLKQPLRQELALGHVAHLENAPVPFAATDWLVAHRTLRALLDTPEKKDRLQKRTEWLTAEIAKKHWLKEWSAEIWEKCLDEIRASEKAKAAGVLVPLVPCEGEETSADEGF